MDQNDYDYIIQIARAKTQDDDAGAHVSCFWRKTQKNDHRKKRG